MAFLPGSQVDVRPVRDAGPLMHMPQPFQILKMDRRRGNIVVSRRAVLEESRAEQRAEIVSRLAEGDVIDGVVKNITEYGAFVDLGGVDGLLHVTDMAWRRVNHPSEILSIGETVKVQVIKINKETQRISLGMKQLQADPWDTVEEKFPIGSRAHRPRHQHHRLRRLRGAGAGRRGAGARLRDVLDQEERAPGQDRLDQPGGRGGGARDRRPEAARVSLGLKQTQGNPWENFARNHPNGTVIEGEVKNITEFGLFVGLDGDIDGMVHLSRPRLEPLRRGGDPGLPQGRRGQGGGHRRGRGEGAHLALDQGGRGRPLRRRGRGREARRRRDRDGHLDRGRRHRGGIRRDEDLHPPLRPQPRPLRAAARALHQGRHVDARVVNIDSKTRKLGLSIKAREIAEEKEAVEQYGSSDSGASLGDILGAALKRKDNT